MKRIRHFKFPHIEVSILLGNAVQSSTVTDLDQGSGFIKLQRKWVGHNGKHYSFQ